MVNQEQVGPTTERQRHVILDALRGMALMGIALANFPEFGLWTFLSNEEQMVMPTANVDEIVRFLQYLLVDGKFYTIFSLLFGVGFSLILARHGRRLFVRRMLILVCIGFLHLMFIWSGDILLLYAIGGLMLTLFVGLNDRMLLVVALSLILIPIGLDALTEFRGIDFASPFYQQWWQVAEAQGINEDNFAFWLRDAHSYRDMFAFLEQGACERLWEFVEGHRLPKVVGLFILGYLAGKHRLYARLHELPLKRLFWPLLLIALPLSLLCHQWSSLGPDDPLAALCRERHPSGCLIYNRCMHRLSAPSQCRSLPMAGRSRPYGTHQLHLAVADRHRAVLWSGLRPWYIVRSDSYRTHSTCRLPSSDFAEPTLAPLFSLWPAGMALATAHLWSLFPFSQGKVVRKSQKSLVL